MLPPFAAPAFPVRPPGDTRAGPWTAIRGPAPPFILPDNLRFLQEIMPCSDTCSASFWRPSP